MLLAAACVFALAHSVLGDRTLTILAAPRMICGSMTLGTTLEKHLACGASGAAGIPCQFSWGSA